MKTPQKFSGPGWYAFGLKGKAGGRVYWCEEHDRQLISLSDGRNAPWEYLFSHMAFDHMCIAHVTAVGDAA